MGRDKKVVAGSIRFVLLRSIGDAFVTADVALPDLRAVLDA
jgi:3-dehydroquinate synthase